ncbi:MAG: histidine--tRNA ligase [Candidatus Goldbacteria bacterium]|nr:histidine--tRNA ligase [Candidatus Goldiibacteriota bacterium]
MKFQRLRGTKDILPPESLLWEKVIINTFNILKNYGIKLIITPTIEDRNLFIRSIGEGTDIVIKEMYEFKDKKGRDIALRPEGTASIVRAYIENSLPEKIDLCYLGPMFRYEKPQKGRNREFYQIGVESFGVASIYKDVEIIKLAYDILKAVGINDFTLRINMLNCKECNTDYIKSLTKYLNKNINTLCDNCRGKIERNAILRVLDCKEDKCRSITANAPLIKDFLCKKCMWNLDLAKDLLNNLKIPFKEDFHLVRGLDYYTGLVFEFITDKLGPQQNTLLAGGRYDNLVKEMGGKDIPATGFAMGIDRIVEVLAAEGIQEEQKLNIYIVSDSERMQKAFLLLLKLRENNISAVMNFDNKSFKSQMREADDKKVKFVLILGEEEEKGNFVSMKDMKTGEQKKVGNEIVIEEVKNLLAQDVIK